MKWIFDGETPAAICFLTRIVMLKVVLIVVVMMMTSPRVMVTLRSQLRNRRGMAVLTGHWIRIVVVIDAGLTKLAANLTTTSATRKRRRKR